MTFAQYLGSKEVFESLDYAVFEAAGEHLHPRGWHEQEGKLADLIDQLIMSAMTIARSVNEYKVGQIDRLLLNLKEAELFDDPKVSGERKAEIARLSHIRSEYLRFDRHAFPPMRVLEEERVSTQTKRANSRCQFFRLTI